MRRLATIAVLLAVIPACHRDMRDQPRYDTLEASSLFANHQSARPTPAGTVVHAERPDDDGGTDGTSIDGSTEAVTTSTCLDRTGIPGRARIEPPGRRALPRARTRRDFRGLDRRCLRSDGAS